MKPYNCYSTMVYMWRKNSEKGKGNEDEALQLLFYYGIPKGLG